MTQTSLKSKGSRGIPLDFNLADEVYSRGLSLLDFARANNISPRLVYAASHGAAIAPASRVAIIEALDKTRVLTLGGRA